MVKIKFLLGLFKLLVFKRFVVRVILLFFFKDIFLFIILGKIMLMFLIDI